MVSKRQPKKCPVPQCHRKQTNLSRHLRQIHGWTTETARNACQNYGLRKKYTFADPEKEMNRKNTGKDKKAMKDYHRSRRCPVDGCCAYVVRLGPHLTGKRHRIEKNSVDLRNLLSLAKKSKATELKTTSETFLFPYSRIYDLG